MASQRGRLTLTLVVLMTGMVALAGRALQLQAVEAPAYAASAASNIQRGYTLLPTRGQIADRNGTVMAASEPAVRVIADPRMISRNGVDERVSMGPKQTQKAAAAPKAVAKILAKRLGGTPEDYRDDVTKKGSDGKLSRYVVVKRHVSSYDFDLITKDMEAGNWFGVFSSSDPVRTYPSGTVASNVVGFVNGDGVGAGGMEYMLNKQLKGTEGKESYEASTYGRIPLGRNTLVPAVNGVSYNLTLDSQMQLTTQSALATAVRDTKAESGEAIVMNVKTGEILSMASMPTFDSSNLAKTTSKEIENRAVETSYEPGSVQKVLTMAALADKGLVTADSHLVVPPSISSGGGTIKDAFSHGTLNLTTRGVIAYSSNIGTTLLTRKMDKATLARYLRSFGLGSTTGIGLPGEATGSVPGASMADFTRDQISFGQGLSVTAVQEAAAVAAIVNGGVYHSPTIIRSARNGDGEQVKVPGSASRRVISAKASAQVRDMMEAVVTLEPDRAVKGYRTIGKTGTAQRIDPSCHCYRGYTASFVGVGPAENPSILTYVVLNNPVKGHEGSGVALPVAQQIMSVALPRYGVEPSTTKAPRAVLEYQP
ncbi:MAG: penicillin-binding protein 2 [Acidipropionibacterium jensenii]|uniref:peptidoglycan D,D-transpeptidase FtsI family protein n=1 Tax=Acidipropionibacterium jensenii TaxID=1749 RepID=UPI0026491AE0|nr:penicillin-binding protein 2 [Acidipropionibacterium jensenii]MDN6511943.1 penicillin-binding protein 2 [Acidipropionibacterium jensenii]